MIGACLDTMPSAQNKGPNSQPTVCLIELSAVDGVATNVEQTLWHVVFV